MRLPEAEVVHGIHQVDEEMRMQIDQNSLVHLMSILTNLYSDPMLAVIREYSTNAADSHIEAGNPDPIRIILPTPFNPNFIVKDQGVGLGVSDLRDVYSMYGKSTKRDSDAVTGMLGLGCKAGLTYALSFTVVAVKDGLKTVASVTKDLDGVGTIKILDTSTTTEPNGVEINIPVKTHDVEQFRRTAEEYYKYWRKGTVLVSGEEPEFPEALWLDEDVAVLHTAHRTYGVGDSRIVMGNVAYPFQHDFKHTIVAWVPMGEVNFTPSREALHDTTRTKDTVEVVKRFVKDRFSSALKEMIAAADSPYTALKIAARWQWSIPSRRHLRNLNAVIDPPRPAFNFSGQHVRQIKTGIPASNLISERHIITDFPFQAVSPRHRERLHHVGMADCLILPEDTDYSILEGRDKVVKWDWVVDHSPDPPRTKRGPVVKQNYTFRLDGRNYTTPLDDTKPIVYYGMREYPRFDWFPEVQFVNLYASQFKRLCREHPTAVPLDQYTAKAKEKALAALKEDDIIYLHHDKRIASQLQNVADQLDDDDLRRFLKIAAAGPSTRVSRVNLMGLTYQVKKNPFQDQLVKRYPLLGMISLAGSQPSLASDFVTYLNTKFAQE